MTTVGAPIDASIRRAALLSEARGNIVPDSSTTLADTPQLVMEPTTSERFSLKFADGLGLTDDYGNVYDGYGGKTSSKFEVTHTDPPSSLTDTLDSANLGDIPVYNDVNERYEPKSLQDESIAVYAAGISAGDLLVYNGTSHKFDPKTKAELLIMETDGTTPNDGDMVVWSAADGAWVPVDQVITDWITLKVELPVDATYTLCIAVPYDTSITSVAGAVTAGPSLTLSVPNTGGVVAAGDDLQLVVSGTDGTSRDLTATIIFTRLLGVA